MTDQRITRRGFSNSILLGALTASTAVAGQPPQTAWQANQRLGAGINLGNMLEAPSEGAWGARFKDHYAGRIRSAGFSHVRLPVKWSSRCATEAPYRIQPEFMQRVRHIVEHCLSQDLAVVLNVHHFDEIFQDPDASEPRLQAIWKQIGAEFHDASPLLYFELLNEPHNQLSSERWNQMVPGLLSIVRQQHPRRPVVIGGGSWNSHTELQNLRLPNDDRMLIATFHYYLPFPFTHQGASWTAPNVPPVGRHFPADDGEVGQMAEHFATARRWSESQDRPVYVGEFGSYSAAAMADRVRWTNEVRTLITDSKFSSAYWEFCSGFGAYDPDAEVWRDELLQALMGGRSNSGR